MVSSRMQEKAQRAQTWSDLESYCKVEQIIKRKTTAVENKSAKSQQAHVERTSISFGLGQRAERREKKLKQ